MGGIANARRVKKAAMMNAVGASCSEESLDARASKPITAEAAATSTSGAQSQSVRTYG